MATRPHGAKLPKQKVHCYGKRSEMSLDFQRQGRVRAPPGGVLLTVAGVVEELGGGEDPVGGRGQ